MRRKIFFEMADLFGYPTDVPATKVQPCRRSDDSEEGFPSISSALSARLRSPSYSDSGAFKGASNLNNGEAGR